MPAAVRFALTFSGQDAFAQEHAATALLAQTDPGDHAARARLHAIVAAARVLSAPGQAASAAAEAARDADLAGDEVTRAWALTAACIVDLSGATVHERLSMTREILRIAHSTGEIEFVPTAFLLHLAALAELGLIAELDLALSPTGSLLSSFPALEHSRLVAWFRCLRATIDGQPELAEQLAGRAYARAQEEGDPDAQSVWVGQLAIIRWMQGRVVELEPAFLHARQTPPHEPVWTVSLAWMWLQQGRRSAARGLITALPPIAELPVDRNWLATACILAVVAAELRAYEIAEAVYAALQPFEDRLVTIGLGVTCWGTVARPLALLAEALGHEGTAVAHYRTAIEVAARTGAHPWLAEVQAELAALLARAGGGAGHREAVSLATEAVATGRALRLHGIEGPATALLASLASPAADDPASPASDPVEAAPMPRIRVLGGFEVTAADGTVARWQSRKARQLLKILVARRGVAVSRDTLLHLLWPDEAPQRLGNRFSVAATAVRRALDPAGTQPSGTYLETRGGLVRLRIERIDVDVERFLHSAHSALGSQAPTDARSAELAEALAAYRGDPLEDETDELWAEELRRDAHLAFFAVAHALGELADASGDHLSRVEAYGRILSADAYDQRAHEGLVDALTRLGSHSRAAAARADYVRRMGELGIPVHLPAP